MGLLDRINNASADSLTQAKTQKGVFRKDGYFSWDEASHLHEKDVAIGAIFPPYKEWLNERIEAVSNNRAFGTPFALAMGLHGVGLGKKDKVYAECRKTLVRDNKSNDSYPLLNSEVIAGGDQCPLCNTCWDVLFPARQEAEAKYGKNSAEYKAADQNFKSATPQQKFLINFKPANSAKVLVMEVPKGLYDKIYSIHVDKMQPDLLWPSSITTAGVMSSCIQIRRKPGDGNAVTQYEINTIWQGIPTVYKEDRKTFDEERYLALLGTMTDLRQESLKLVPTAARLQAAVDALDRIAPQRTAIITGVRDQVNKATEGIVPQVAAPLPIAVAPVPPAPVLPPPPLPAAAIPEYQPPAPPAPLPASGDAASAIAALQSLISGKK